jgi:hypothetical protein
MDHRISRSLVDGLDDSGYFWGIVEPVWPTSEDDETQLLAEATPGQRALYVLTLFMREVDNGGLDQFFYNSSGAYAKEVGRAFTLLGADRHASAFGESLAIFPGGEAPSNRDERIRLLHMTPTDERETYFRPLEGRLTGGGLGERGLWPYFRRYIAEHPAELFTD